MVLTERWEVDDGDELTSYWERHARIINKRRFEVASEEWKIMVGRLYDRRWRRGSLSSTLLIYVLKLK